jgi:hypothetical protein
MGDLDVIHGLFTTGKPELLRPVYNVCILVRKKHGYSANWFSTNVEFYSTCEAFVLISSSCHSYD